MAFIEAMQWAELALPEQDMGKAWQRVRASLAVHGMPDATLIYGQPTQVRRVRAPARKFGLFLDADWDQRIATDPKLARGDPIAKRFFVKERPLHVARGNELFRSMSKQDQAFYQHYDEHDVRAGAVWPVHDRRAGAIHLICTWTKSSPRDYLDVLRHFSTEIHVATTYFCEALRVRQLAELTPKLALSPRERECLLWVQAGRSTKQIGDRLAIGDATVNEYIANAMRKLDASNRVQAAARATMLGIIRP